IMKTELGLSLEQMAGYIPDTLKEIQDPKVIETKLEPIRALGAVVYFLGEGFPDKEIKNLMSRFAYSVYQNPEPIPIMHTDQVIYTEFLVQLNVTELSYGVVVPNDLPNLIKLDEVRQLESIVHTASLVDDFSKILDSGDITKLAKKE